MKRKINAKYCLTAHVQLRVNDVSKVDIKT